MKSAIRIAIAAAFAVTLFTTGCAQKTVEPQYMAGDQQEVHEKDHEGIDSHIYGDDK